MKPIVQKPLLAGAARPVVLLASIVLLTAVIVMMADGHLYEAAAAFFGLIIVWLIIWLTRRMFPGRLLPVLQIMVVLILFESVFLGTVLDFNDTLPYFDKLNHSLAGAMLAMLGLVTFYWLNPEQRVRLTVRPGFIVLYNIGFAITGKVFWEFYEFAGDRVLGANMQRWQFGATYALTDTMMDLAVGMVGSLIISLLVRHQLVRDAPLFYRDWISGFFEARQSQ